MERFVVHSGLSEKNLVVSNGLLKKLPSFCLLVTIIFMLRKSLSSLKLTGFQPRLDRDLEAK